MNRLPHIIRLNVTRQKQKAGRVTPCAPWVVLSTPGAHRVTRPASWPLLWLFPMFVLLAGDAFAQTNVTGATNSVATETIRSPVDYFRELLAASPGELAEQLAGYEPDKQRGLRAKIDEYKAMPVADRELKLRVTEIRWHLTALMRLPADKRAARLARVPEVDRPLIEDRLKRWQIVPPTLQTSLLENETTLDYLARMGVDAADGHRELRKILPSPLREELDERLAEWRRLPPNQREGLQNFFLSFFNLSDAEQHEVLKSLSAKEREQMAESVRKFEQLPREQRLKCLDALGRFTVLDPAQRYVFVRNADRWKEMTPAERERWREVVTQLPEMPPLPPGLNTNRMPPLPPGVEPSARN